MSPKVIGVVAGVVALVVTPVIASTALAEPNAPAAEQQNAQLIQKLQDAREIAAQNEASWTQEPITRQEFADQATQIDHLIQKLQQGEKVSPSEIDDALKAPETPY
jgi:hypothetical protein